MGRSVTIPVNVTKAVALGSVPVQFSFIEAMGKGSTIANTLPDSFIKQGRWKYQYVFAPQIATAPNVQDASGAVSIESLLLVNPDIVFTMDKPTVTALENRSMPVVYLQWTNPEDVKQLMTLMGQIYDEPARASQYSQYFDSKVKQVNTTVSSVPADQRPKVLLFSPKTMSVPHKIGEWWISEAGGIAVSENNRTAESYTFDMEQLLKWNPDVIITTAPDEITYLYNDTRFSTLNAVKNEKIYTTPVGAHVWSHRTIETPLMVEWAASKFFPEKITEAQMISDSKSFYQQFFGVTLSDDQIREILSGKASTTSTVTSKPTSTVNVTDLAGRTVTVPANVTRVASLVGPGYEKMIMLGQTGKMVTRGSVSSPWALKVAPDLKNVPTVANAQDPNVEDLLSKNTQVVFFWDTKTPLEKMNASGLPVVVTQVGTGNPDSAEKFLSFEKQEVQLFGQVLGPEAKKKADDWCTYFDEKVKYVTSRTSNLTPDQKPKVYYVRGPDALTTHGRNSYTEWYVELAGGDLVTKNTEKEIMTSVTMEQVLAWNPDVIFMGRVNNTTLITDDPKWSQVKAVKDGKVYVNPYGVMYWDYSSEGPLLMEYIAKKLHPELFTDLDMTKEVKDYYKRFYGYDLTDDEANRILSFMSPA